MPTRNVVLSKQQEKIIRDLVSTGQYQNASEVLREGLRLLARREAEDKAKLHALREAARIGFGALDRGEFKEFADADDLGRYLKKIGDQVIKRSSK
jgi:antitoxin ParD1/3/4